jgi:hypothetical protein
MVPISVTGLALSMPDISNRCTRLHWRLWNYWVLKRARSWEGNQGYTSHLLVNLYDSSLFISPTELGIAKSISTAPAWTDACYRLLLHSRILWLYRIRAITGAGPFGPNLIIANERSFAHSCHYYGVCLEMGDELYPKSSLSTHAFSS